MSDIDWSKAPEGATHYYPCIDCFYLFDKHGDDFVFNGTEKELCSDISCFKGCLIPRPETKPAYTKAMFDNGVMPLVGMEYEHGVVLVGADKEGMYVISEHGISIIAELSAIKPIDTRTDKERAVDDLNRELTKLNNNIIDEHKTSSNFHSECFWLIDIIKAGKIHGVTFTGEE